MPDRPPGGEPLIRDEVRYRLLNLIAERPEASQRELAAELGMSLGKVNYCLRAFVDRGLIKARNFRNSRNKLAYAYLLTPRGVEEKAQVTLRFLAARMREYDALEAEIARLTAEVRAGGGRTIHIEGEGEGN